MRAACLLSQRREEVVVDARPGEHPRGSRAVLAGVEVAGARDSLGGRLDVGVVEDDDRRLAAELEVDALEVSAAAWATSRPARTLPVIDTIAGSRVVHHAAPVLRSPQTTLKTPGGSTSRASSAIRTVVSGVVSDGFSTTVLPAARRRELPRGHQHRVVPGVTWPHTPTGSRRIQLVWPAMYSAEARPPGSARPRP